MVPPHIRESTELLLARMLNEYAYCPRLFYLEYIYREWADSNHTLEGQAVHRRVDEEVGELPDPAELLASDEQFQARSILLSAPKPEGGMENVELLGRFKRAPYSSRPRNWGS